MLSKPVTRMRAAWIPALIVLASLVPTGSAGAAASGKLLGWGDGGYGALGRGTDESHYTPKGVSGLTGIKQVASGYNYSVALKTDGTVWAWGYNGSGSLGNGTTNDSYTPTSVANLTGVKSIAVGQLHVLAVKKNGTVWAWGLNGAGQLGLNHEDISYSPVPIRVEGLTDVRAVGAGYNFSVAVMENGTVNTWGSDNDEALGNGAGESSSFVPTTIAGITNARAVASSETGTHTLALLANGKVKGWGYNAYGQVGNGEEGGSPVATPTTVLNLSDVKAVSVGYVNSLALKTDGTVRAWGSGSEGELGPDVTSSPTPVAISGLARIVAIASGSDHNVALRDDGKVKGWGDNQWAQSSGDGDPVPIDGIVTVPNLSGVTAIGAGQYRSFAVK